MKMSRKKTQKNKQTGLAFQNVWVGSNFLCTSLLTVRKLFNSIDIQYNSIFLFFYIVEPRESEDFEEDEDEMQEREVEEEVEVEDPADLLMQIRELLGKALLYSPNSPFRNCVLCCSGN